MLFEEQSRTLDPLDGRELAKKVAQYLIKAEQKESIPDVIEYLETKKGPRPTSVHPLGLFIHEGIVRLAGRLGNTKLPFSTRFPIYYSPNSPLIRQRVLEMHITSNHAGHGITKSKLFQNLWIPKATNTIKHIIRE